MPFLKVPNFMGIDSQSQSRGSTARVWYEPGRPSPVLGGLWDLVTTYSCAYDPTYSLPYWPYIGYPNF